MNLRRLHHALMLAALAAITAGAAAQFDPSRVVSEAAAVAARFPDPDVRYGTPGLRAGRLDMPSHDEALAFAHDLARVAPSRLRIERLGASQEGRDLLLLILAGSGGMNTQRPTVLVLGQQHGNEPAGGEAALALAETLVSARSALLDRVNVLIIPRANPDGADRFARTTANGIDVNRDHLLLQTPEARLIAAVARTHRPQVVLDLHEFTVGDRWVKKFGVVERYDALIQPATVGNLHPAIARLAETEFEQPVRRAIARAGQEMFTYHTTSQDPDDKVVSMGGVQPDTGRNVNGLRQAVSLLVETRGVGIGRAHFARRVHAHVTAAIAAIESAARLGPQLVSRARAAGDEVAAAACTGSLVVEAEFRPTTQTMGFLDAQTGAERRLDVAWRSASPLRAARRRPRPCGYVLAATESVAIERLRALGVEVQQVVVAGDWRLERYVIDARADGQRLDARGVIDGGANIRVFRVRLEAAVDRVEAGTFYVSLAQPLAGLAIAALEPDSQSSYAANRLLELDANRLRRVLEVPPATGKSEALIRWQGAS